MLLFIDGFDHFSQADALLKKWNGTTAGTWTVSTTSGRRGGGCARSVVLASAITRILAGAHGTLIGGVAVSPTAAATGTCDLMVFGDSGISNATAQVTVAVDSNMALRAYRGTTSAGTLLGTSANNALTTGSYQYVEAKVFVSATVGTVDVMVNGVSVLSLSGLNTKNTANSTISQFALLSINGTETLFDDVYVCDSTGSVNNGFLGDCRVDTSFPDSDGFYSSWTTVPSGATHFSCVKARDPSLARYVASSTVGARDSYGVTDLASITGSILGVQANAYGRKSDAGSRSLSLFARSVSTNADSAAETLDSSGNYHFAVFETDPNGSVTWTEAAFDTAQFGIKVAA